MAKKNWTGAVYLKLSVYKSGLNFIKVALHINHAHLAHHKTPPAPLSITVASEIGESSR